MKRAVAALISSCLFLSACSSPNDIILGPEPLKQMAEQGDKFKRMPEEDRMLLASYLTLSQMSQAFGGDVKPVAGRTVGEVLKDARGWKERLKLKAAKDEQDAKEAAKLREKVEAENQNVAKRIAEMVTIAVTNKRVVPKDIYAGRYSELLMINYALENKSAKPVRQIKGVVSFTDPTGETVGTLNVTIDDLIQPGAVVKTDTGSGWRTNEFSRGEIEKIAEKDFSSMKGSFKATAIAFGDGEVIKTAE
jgi:hypothetical protein